MKVISKVVKNKLEEIENWLNTLRETSAPVTKEKKKRQICNASYKM